MANSELDSSIIANPQDGDLAKEKPLQIQLEKKSEITPQKDTKETNVDKYAKYKIETGNMADFANYLRSPSKKYSGGPWRDSFDSSDSSSDDESVTERRPIARKKGSFAEQVKQEANTKSDTFYRDLVSQKSIEIAA